MKSQTFIRPSCIQSVRLALVMGLLLLLPGVHPALAKPLPAGANRLYFVENRGQLDPQVSYYLQARDRTLYFTPTGVTMALSGAASSAGLADRWVVKLEFVGGRARPAGQARAETVVSYFRGPRDRWQMGLPTYTGLVYPDLWPGVDLVYTLSGDRLKYQFTVEPGTDPARIRLAYRGATAVHLAAGGRLQVTTPAAGFTDEAPHAYQVIAGRYVPVEVAYQVAPPLGLRRTPVPPQVRGGRPAAAGVTEYGFRVGDYDPTRPLVLDPAMILYAGFIGGTQRENGYSIAVDAGGYAYVAGETRSIADFPAVVGPDLSHNGGPYNGDAFIARVRADGTGLVYAGFIGGSGEDYAYGVAVDASGNAYVTGSTASNDFPWTVGAYDTSYNGGGDAFVAKVNAAGTGLVYATYIGDVVSPTTNDSGEDIAVDGSRNAYVLINTSLGPYGGHDTSVVKLNAAGSALAYVEYIGGGGDDDGDSLALDADRNAYVTGSTTSNDFPWTLGAYDTSYNGGGDAFVAKVNAAGTGLVYATYIGDVFSASTIDAGEGIAVDSGGRAYVLVNTSDGPFGGYDTSVFKLNAAGSALVYTKYIGGVGIDFGSDLALDAGGRAYLAGTTTSSADFPTTNWPPEGYDAPQEAFAAQVSADGAGLVYAGFIAGSGTGCGGIAVDSAGNAYVTGTNWRGEDFPAVVGPDLSANGERDAFVVKISPLRLYLPVILK